jgi:hypothetical protein
LAFRPFWTIDVFVPSTLNILLSTSLCFSITNFRLSKYCFSLSWFKEMILPILVPSAFLRLILGFLLRNKTNHSLPYAQCYLACGKSCALQCEATLRCAVLFRQASVCSNDVLKCCVLLNSVDSSSKQVSRHQGLHVKYNNFCWRNGAFTLNCIIESNLITERKWQNYARRKQFGTAATIMVRFITSIAR